MYSPFSASSPDLTIAIDILKPAPIYCPLTPPDEEVSFHMEVEIDHEAVIVEVKARREKEQEKVVAEIDEPEPKEEMSIEEIKGSEPDPEEPADAHNNETAMDSDDDSWASASFEDRFSVEIEYMAQILEEKLCKTRFD